MPLRGATGAATAGSSSAGWHALLQNQASGPGAFRAWPVCLYRQARRAGWRLPGTLLYCDCLSGSGAGGAHQPSGERRCQEASHSVQPSSLMAQPAFQILVMWLILPSSNSIT
jgi:hypothetical protein